MDLTEDFLMIYFQKRQIITFFLVFPGELAHALRFLASVVSQSFMAFGDILELNKKYLELSGGVNRIFEMEELLCAAQNGKYILLNLA
jgi:hypothetical protein